MASFSNETILKLTIRFMSPVKTCSLFSSITRIENGVKKTFRIKKNYFAEKLYWFLKFWVIHRRFFEGTKILISYPFAVRCKNDENIKFPLFLKIKFLFQIVLSDFLYSRVRLVGRSVCWLWLLRKRQNKGKRLLRTQIWRLFLDNFLFPDI